MESDFDVKIILLGESDVGKTSLIERFVENKFKDSPSKRSIHKYEKVIEIEENQVKVILWDTAGREAYYNLVKSYYHIADGALFIYDVQNSDTFNAVSKRLKDFKEVNKNAEILIVANKAEDESERSVSVTDVKHFVQTENLDCLEVSAKTNKNVNILFTHFVRKILVAKGILPYSNDSQLTELEISGAYVIPSPVSPELHKTVNISSNFNTSNTICEEFTDEQHTSNTINTHNIESAIGCVESPKQDSFSAKNASSTIEPVEYGAKMIEQDTFNPNNMSSTEELSGSCTESTEYSLNAMESASNFWTDESPEKEAIEPEDNEVDDVYVFYSKEELNKNLDEDSRPIESADIAEEYFEITRDNMSLS